MRIATSLLVVAVVATTAHAESPEAEALFRQGKKLMKQKSFAAACDKFDASERIEPRIGTELNLGDCLARIGKNASAWASFIKAAQTAQRNQDRDREAEASKRAKVLEPKLVYLTISVPSLVPRLVVHRNDTVVDRAMFDQPVPVDPDDYTIVAEAPDHERWHQTIIVGAKNQTIEVPRLTPIAEPPRTANPPPTDKPPPLVVSPTPPAEPSSLTPSRKRAAGLGLLGLAAVGIGVIFGMQANSAEQQSDVLCPTVRCNDTSAIDLNQRARTYGLVADIGIIGGSAMVAGAVVWWIAGRPGRRDKIAIVPSTNGIAILGRY